MNHVGTILIIFLSIFLFIAIVWVAVNVGRVVFSIIRDARRAKQNPPLHMQHPELGTLTFESDLWSGQMERDGKPIHFYIAGTESQPDGKLVDQLRAAISKLPELERAALEFIHAKEPDALGDFTFESLDFLWEQKPENFAMEFALAGDDDGIWRVEFESGHPKSVGRDD